MDSLSLNCKLLADGTFVFSVVHDVTRSPFELINDLATISESAFQWKMHFNPDPTKPNQEIIFSRNLRTVSDPSIIFNNNSLRLCTTRWDLGLVSDSKLNFIENIKHILSKINKSLGSLHKLQPVLPSSSLLAIYKTLNSGHLNYAEIVYDQSCR